MHIMTVAIGLGAMLFGLSTFIIRLTSPDKLGKLQPMQERFGAGVGAAIHGIAYIVAPLGFGIVALVLGLQGQSLF